MGTILVVDDDEHIREFLRKSCRGLGTVVEAADGAQALAAARWSHPDLVIMDLDMPVIDGFEAARLIKSDSTVGDPVLVALTGNETVNAVPRARAAGYSYFVRKETNARSFIETIECLLKEAISRSAGSSSRPQPQSEVTPARLVRGRGSTKETGEAPKHLVDRSTTPRRRSKRAATGQASGASRGTRRPRRRS